MESNAVRWLRVSYWAGAIVDFIAGCMMVLPGLFALMNRPAAFQPAADYRYAMGMGAPLMFGWTVLLLWADRKPLERKTILPITLLVIFGEVITQIWGISVGFVAFDALALSFVSQSILVALFCFAYFNAGRIR
ncbi:MAG: hypothetical protein AB1649_19620 [Chloroflexota bacterium]